MDDITPDTNIISVIMPNRNQLSDANQRTIPLPDGVSDLVLNPGDEWNKWYNWQINIDELETITGYDFFSDLPDEIENIIEGRSRSQLRARNQFFEDLSSPLLAENNAVSSESILIQSVGENSATRSSNSEAITVAGGSISHTTDSIGEIDIDHSHIATTASRPIASSETTFIKSRQIQFDFNERSVIHLALSKMGSNQNTFVEDSLTDIRSVKTSPIQVGSSKTSPFEVGVVEYDIDQITSTKVSSSEVTSSKVESMEIGVTEVESREVSLSAFDSSPEFFSIHNSSPEIINELNNSATNIWSDLLQPQTQLDIDFQITDLPTGQLAEAEAN